MLAPTRLYSLGLLALVLAGVSAGKSNPSEKTAEKIAKLAEKKKGAAKTAAKQVTLSKAKPAEKPATLSKAKPAEKPAAKPAAKSFTLSKAKPAGFVRKPGMLYFPFALPGATGLMESKSRYAFDKTCFRFIHAAVGNRTNSSDKGFLQSLESSCSGARCAEWIKSLSLAINQLGDTPPTSAHGVSAIILSKPYGSWCRDVYHDVIGREDPFKMHVTMPAVKPANKTDDKPLASAQASKSSADGTRQSFQEGLRDAGKMSDQNSPAKVAPAKVVPVKVASAAPVVLPKVASAAPVMQPSPMPSKPECFCVHRHGKEICHGNCKK